ncbi:efflux RND transporter periplasmic adaptor subunit [Emcibacter nanhaiensis]|uniref:Efflux RND transporter periplasmic adaptor subunit n=1 Tax=Emcibacter nanhaiensis TaxID=1505037 RepID=A0A501PD48_9PROT|nr:efflux RND transporter periplasmic adaptor subunit [Emcibacter nanhaiensis]TPD57927.1 efflux RND transporter periplasmic adaptor subunit [Emcibacter nanhaiensis]
MEQPDQKKTQKVVDLSDAGPSATRTKGGTGGQKSGSGMDRRIERKKTPFTRRNLSIAAFVLLCALAFYFLYSSSGRSYRIDGSRVAVAEVVRGNFEDFIPVRSRVIPARTVFLDSIEGGRVEKIFVEDGARVEQEQPLVELSNTALQLDVISREAEVTEQLNNLRTIELSLEQNRLEHKRNLVEIDYQITRLTRQLDRRQELVKKGNVSQAEYENTQDELEYYQKRRQVTLESQASDERLQKQQMKQLTASTEQLEKNLVIARKNLENLLVRAPVAGKLTALNAEIGQSVARGERLGQIDDPEHFKLNTQIDEFYLGRVDIGQRALIEVGGREYSLTIQKVYPRVRNGQFEVDMIFAGDRPQNIRRGQTIQTKLYLGDTDKAVVIPNGSFYSDTGGAWIFVVNPAGDVAVRRDVRLGRRNTRVIEVLDGLEPGEKVITSPYTNFLEMDRLDLDGSTEN